MHHASYRFLLFGALCGLTACEPLGPAVDAPVEVTEVALQGQLEVYPSSLDFGTLSVTSVERGEALITAANLGDGPLVVLGLDTVQGDDAFTVHLAPGDAGPMVLQPGQSVEIPVRFQPSGAGDFTATLSVPGARDVSLRGSGAAPQGAVVTEVVAFGDTIVGCEVRADGWIANTGDELLRVIDLEILGSEDISLGDDLPVALAPDLAEPIEVVFTPQISGAHDATLVVTTNDPEVPTRSIALTGIATIPRQVEESFIYAPVVRADVLFVVDSSASVQSRLRHSYGELEVLFETLDQGGVDWQVAVTNGERDCTATPSPWIDHSATREVAAQELYEAFALYGEGGAELLELALATAERTDALDCLDGFLREITQLHVVLISDRTEASPEKVGYYVGGLSNHLSGGGDLVISAITGHGKSSCLDGGAAIDAANLTDGLSFDLCTAPDWRAILQDLAQVSAATEADDFTFTLNEEPVLESIEVHGDDGALDIWSYDPGSRRLTLSGANNRIQIGDALTVSYATAGECD